MSMLISEPSVQPDPPIKRKRGRPPKANKPEDAFPTFTMQLESSPLFGGPNAEFVSSQVLRSGEPDSFTPLMKVSPSKVSPSPRRKKRRKSSNFSSPLEPLRDAKNGETGSSRSYIASAGDDLLHSRASDSLYKVISGSVDEAYHFQLPHETALRPAFVHTHSSPGYSTRQDHNDSNRRSSTSQAILSSGTSDFISPTRVPASSHISNLACDDDHGSRKDIAVSHDEFDFLGFELVIDENGEATFASRQPLSANSSHSECNSTVQSQDVSATNLVNSSKGSVTDMVHADQSTNSCDDKYSAHPHYAADEDRRMSFSHVPPLRPDEFEETEVVYPSSAAISDAAIYHSIEMHGQHANTRQICDELDAHQYDLMPQPLRSEDKFDRLAVDTSNLMFDEDSSDSFLESADARFALRKMFGKISKC